MYHFKPGRSISSMYISIPEVPKQKLTLIKENGADLHILVIFSFLG
jgi:hypothetical protein